MGKIRKTNTTTKLILLDSVLQEVMSRKFIQRGLVQKYWGWRHLLRIQNLFFDVERGRKIFLGLLIKNALKLKFQFYSWLINLMAQFNIFRKLIQIRFDYVSVYSALSLKPQSLQELPVATFQLFMYFWQKLVIKQVKRDSPQ